MALGPCTSWWHHGDHVPPLQHPAKKSTFNTPKPDFRTIIFLAFFTVSMREGKKPVEVFVRSVDTCGGTQWLGATKEQREGSSTTPQSWFTPLPPVSASLGLFRAFMLHFGRCWFVRQWVSFGLGAPRGSSHALTPGEDLHNCFGNLHIAKPSNILHMLEILET